jgi:hypothetical protein
MLATLIAATVSSAERQKNVYNSLSCWKEEEDGQCAGSLQIHRPGKSYYDPFRV